MVGCGQGLKEVVAAMSEDSLTAGKDCPEILSNQSCEAKDVKSRNVDKQTLTKGSHHGIVTGVAQVLRIACVRTATSLGHNDFSISLARCLSSRRYHGENNMASI